MDEQDRQVLLAEGLDPDDPRVIAAMDLVRWELSLLVEPATDTHLQGGRR